MSETLSAEARRAVLNALRDAVPRPPSSASITALRRELAVIGCKFVEDNGMAMLAIPGPNKRRPRLVPVVHTYRELCSLYTRGVSDKLGHLLRGSEASGSGAQASPAFWQPTPQNPAAERPTPSASEWSNDEKVKMRELRAQGKSDAAIAKLMSTPTHSISRQRVSQLIGSKLANKAAANTPRKS